MRAYPVRLEWLAIPMVACLLAGAFSAYAEGERRELTRSKGFYILVKPKTFDANKTYDVIVALHGMGDTAPNYAGQFGRMLAGREVLLAVPEGGDKVGPGTSWNTGDLDKVVELLEDLKKNFKVHEKRVLLAGHSAGSLIGWYMVVKRPDLFAFYGQTAQGVTPAVNWLFKERELQAVAERIPIYFSIGTKDPNHPNYEGSLKLLQRLKFKLKSEEPEIGHTVVASEVKAMLAHYDATVKLTGK